MQLHLKLYPKKYITFPFLIGITIMLISLSSISFGNAYWSTSNGDDCMSEHGIGYQNTTFIEQPHIVLDGVADEEAWNYPNVTEYLIPTASNNDSEFFFISYVHIKFVYDANYLYIHTLWNDSSARDLMDMITFCWDVNVTNFTAGMFVDQNVMETLNPHEVIDCWKWACQAMPNGSVYSIQDISYDDNSWFPVSSENQDLITGYTYGTWINNTNHYSVEIKRPLTTNVNENDVQFSENRGYRYAIAIMNNLPGDDHAISWTYELSFSDLPENTDIPENKIDAFGDGWNALFNLTLFAGIGVYLVFRKSCRIH